MTDQLSRMHYSPAHWPNYETFVVRHTLFADPRDLVDLDDTLEGLAKQCSDLAYEVVDLNASDFAAEWARVTLAGVSWLHVARELLDEETQAKADRAGEAY